MSCPDDLHLFFKHEGKVFIIGFIVIGVGLYFGLVKPTQDSWTQAIQESKDKTNAEHASLLLMNCKQLGDWLTQDSWYARDNLIYAQNHYLVNCK
jgi:hypothetical protein